ncbi:MAG: FtsX-like permease family protein [Bryobacteraceae bacterium]|nr:FtsX-like permease family protein [Bryobacteraceae bacterium]
MEIGIRLALGGTSWQVLRSVLGRVFLTVCVGLALGIGVALGVANPLSFLLAQGIQALDPANFGSVAVICLLTALPAAIVPANRLLSVDPIRSLRVE